MIWEWIAPIHVIVAIITALYGFIFPKNPFDYVYLILMYLTFFHWTFLNGECFVTYYVKKVNDPSYIAGKDANITEVDYLFEDYPNMINIGIFIKKIFWTISLYLVLKRCHFTDTIAITFPALFFIYYITKGFTADHYKNQTFLIFQEIIKYIVLLYGIIFSYLLYKRF